MEKKMYFAPECEVIILQTEGFLAASEPLEDGSVAIGMFNLGETPRKIGFICHSIGIEGTQTIRDLWRQKDIATVGAKERWETEVAPHGVVLVRVYPGNDTVTRREGFYPGN